MQILPTGGIAAFEGSNIEKLRKRRLSEGARHWYVKRAEDVIKAAQGPKRLDHGVDDINRYLEEQGRKQGLQE